MTDCHGAHCQPTTCPFCREIAAMGAHDGDRPVVTVPDRYPSAPGHTLIVPTRHVTRVLYLQKYERNALMRALVDVLDRLNSEERPAGFNIGFNDGAAAGQTIPHVHMHVIPRHQDDVEDPRGGLRWVLPQTAPYWRIDPRVAAVPRDRLPAEICHECKKQEDRPHWWWCSRRGAVTTPARETITSL